MREYILQHILFPQDEELADHPELFLRSEKRTSVLEGKLFIKRGDTVDFATYLNGFSLAKWKEYTRLKKTSLVLSMKGKAHISLE